MTQQELSARITFDPQILCGKPTVRGLRISVEHILKALAAGLTQKELLDDYPELEVEDIRAALQYAADLLAEEKVFPSPTGSS